MKLLPYTFLLLIVMSFPTLAQDTTEKSSAIQTQVENKRLVFVAQSVTPARGGLRNLTTRYTFIITPDTVISDLPYFGRAFQAPMNPSDAGIKFTSITFDYTVKNRKKKGWDISIKTRDVNPSIQANLTVFKTGSASLYINANDRQPISYHGYIQQQE